MRIFYTDEAPIDTLLQISEAVIADGDLISKAAYDGAPVFEYHGDPIDIRVSG